MTAVTMLGHVLAEQPLDPAATRPSPLSLYIFLFLAAALVILLASMTLHMRRANRNLAGAKPGTGPAEPAASNGTDPATRG